MKVFEKINKLKGTSATMEEIQDWAIMNGVLPDEFEENLELDCEYPDSLNRIAEETHSASEFIWLIDFLNAEVNHE